MKFEDVKVGMKVKIIKNQDGAKFDRYVGTIGKVIDTYNSCMVLVLELFDGTTDIYWRINEIEPYEEEQKLNYIEQVAKMFGVEVGEEFKILYKDGIKFLETTFVFTNNDLITTNFKDSYISSIGSLITGDLKIEKIIPYAKPIKCSDGEKFNYVRIDGIVQKETFDGGTFSHAMCALGNMFPVDAVIPQPQIDEMVKKLKGDEA